MGLAVAPLRRVEAALMSKTVTGPKGALKADHPGYLRRRRAGNGPRRGRKQSDI